MILACVLLKVLDLLAHLYVLDKALHFKIKYKVMFYGFYTHTLILQNNLKGGSLVKILNSRLAVSESSHVGE